MKTAPGSASPEPARTTQQLNSSLAGIFAGNDPVLVTERSDLAQHLREQGFDCHTFDAVIAGTVPASRTENVVILQVDFALTPPTPAVEQAFPNSRILLVPLAAFSASAQSVQYALERLAEVDFGAAVTNNAAWLDMLQNSEGPLRLTNGSSECAIELQDNLSVMFAKTDIQIEPNEWVAPANFLEVGVIPSPGSDRPAHSITGELVAEGIAVARHKFFLAEVAPKADAAWELLSRCRRDHGFPLRVVLEASIPQAVLAIDGTDVLPSLLPLVDTRFSEAVVELAFASETWNGQTLDFGLNSVMNEAAGGMHVALGTGLHGAHIDFICNSTEVTWTDAAGRRRLSPARGRA